jgi:hypothetical protein
MTELITDSRKQLPRCQQITPVSLYPSVDTLFK